MTNQSPVDLNIMTIETKLALLAELGDSVLETSLLQLVADLSPDQQEALEQFMETDPEPEILLKHLFEHHKNFNEIIMANIAEAQKDLSPFITN